MKIGLVSDTHMPRFGDELPPALRDGLLAHGVELILHMGDLTEPMALVLLEAIAPVIAVAGNNDGPALHARLGTRRVVEAAGVRIGMIHGHEPAGRQRTAEKAIAAFADEDVDVICFGHSHVPCVERIGSLWLVNPGSPTDKRRQPRYTYGILTIEDGVVTPELYEYDRR
jgi:putative phosphoesterase